MTKPRYETHPDHVRSRKALSQQAPFHVNPDGEVCNGKTEYDQGERVYARMLDFCNWDHGYLKIKRDSSGSDLHLTFTWTLTNAAGSYVYVKCNFWELDYGLDMLARKVLEVDDYARKPTPDRRNPGHKTSY